MRSLAIWTGILVGSLAWADAQLVAQTAAPVRRPAITRSAPVKPTRNSSPTTTVPAKPVIQSYTPLFGLPGTHVHIHGSNFGPAPDEDSYVTVLNSTDFRTYTKWPSVSWSDTDIDALVPNEMPLGKVYLMVEADEVLSYEWQPFTVGIPPAISGYSPLSGPDGTTITIHGTGFGATQGKSTFWVFPEFTHDHDVWTPVSWSDNQIIVPVPQNTPTNKYYLMVTVSDLDSIGTYPFEVGIPPSISTYAPLSGVGGTQIALTGQGFGAAQGASSLFLIREGYGSKIPLSVSHWSDVEIDGAVPSQLQDGRYFLYVRVGELDSIGTFPFTVGAPPIITGYSPLSGNPQVILTIYGEHFGQTQGSGQVSVLSSITNTQTPWPVTDWTDTRITVTVPGDMALGKVYLSVSANGVSSIGTYPFTVGVPPSILSYSPTSGAAKTQIVIRGTSFGTTQGTGAVYLAAPGSYTPLTIVSWSDNEVVVSVPPLTPTTRNYLYLVADGLATIGTYPFDVLAGQ